MNLNPMKQRPFSRREALRRTSLGFGSLALAGLMNSSAFGAGLPPGAPHFAPRAKRVIFAYMSGGVSHVDSFDPKPALKARHGQPMPVPVKPTMFNNNGNIMASPWEGQPDPLPPPAPDSSPSVSGNPAEKANSLQTLSPDLEAFGKEGRWIDRIYHVRLEDTKEMFAPAAAWKKLECYYTLRAIPNR